MKVLFFDYWLKGIANFNRLAPEIFSQSPDAEIKMLHLGSWKEPQDKPCHLHEGFESFDISHFKTSSIYKILKKEKPDVVVILNLYSLMDKAIIAFCRKLGIKVVYVSHGRLSAVGSSADLTSRPKKSLSAKLQKEPFLILLNYVYSALIAHKPKRIWQTAKQIIRNNFSVVFPIRYSEELEADEILVYYDSDRQILHEDKGFPLEKIKVVGNPELDNFINLPIVPEEEFFRSTGLSGPYLLYLDDGWVQANLLKKEDFINHLREISSLTHDKGLDMVIKLHPRTPLEDYKNLFEELGIKGFKSEVDFKSLIKHSLCVSSLASTTISMALFLNKRVISPRFGETAGVFKNYPDDVIHYSYTPEDFSAWLQNGLPTATNHSYLEENFKLCDGKAIPRIVKNIISATACDYSLIS